MATPISYKIAVFTSKDLSDVNINNAKIYEMFKSYSVDDVNKWFNKSGYSFCLTLDDWFLESTYRFNNIKLLSRVNTISMCYEENVGEDGDEDYFFRYGKLGYGFYNLTQKYFIPTSVASKLEPIVKSLKEVPLRSIPNIFNVEDGCAIGAVFNLTLTSSGSYSGPKLKRAIDEENKNCIIFLSKSDNISFNSGVNAKIYLTKGGAFIKEADIIKEYENSIPKLFKYSLNSNGLPVLYLEDGYKRTTKDTSVGHANYMNAPMIDSEGVIVI